MPLCGAISPLLFAIAAATIACGASPPRCELAAPDFSGAPLLWRVQRTGGAVWLYGTVHDMGAGDVPPAAWSALDGAPVFASELGDQEPDPREIAELARLPWGQVLDRMLPADDWWELVTAMAGAMSEDELRHARPWFALLRLRSHVARSPRPSMDVALTERARARGIAIEALESWQQQAAALQTGVTVADLSAAIRARNTITCELARLRSVYLAGDLGALTRMLVIPGRTGALLDERNRRWLPRIERYLADRGAFVAVGLGHLLGDGGLLATLERAGYLVEQHAGPASAGNVESSQRVREIAAPRILDSEAPTAATALSSF
jgi:uncharacterized protein YbaP (TraB family)